MDPEINKHLVVERAIDEVLLPFTKSKQRTPVPVVRKALEEFNQTNDSHLTIWSVFQTTFELKEDKKNKENIITPKKPLDTVISIAELARMDREYAWVFEVKEEDERYLEWVKIGIAEKVINKCKSLRKKFN